MSAKWTDMHMHLNMLDTSPELALAEAESQGVHRMITIGTTPDDLPVVEELASKFAPRVFCTLGIHPHEANLWTDEVRDYIRQHAVNPRVVAIGEIGLDYYYDHSPRDQQQKAFRDQMELAEELGLPVEIHTRDAEPDTIQVLNQFSGRVRGLLHCFTGTWELAEAALKVGFDISFSGVVTFKNAEALRDVVRKVPLDRLHVETDSPFLSPVPHRGKKNRPAMVVHTAECVARLKGIALQELSEQVAQNAEKLFPRLR